MVGFVLDSPVLCCGWQVLAVVVVQDQLCLHTTIPPGPEEGAGWGEEGPYPQECRQLCPASAELAAAF